MYFYILPQSRSSNKINQQQYCKIKCWISAFTKEQFDRALATVVPISIYMGLASLGFVVAEAVTYSILSVQGIGSKLLSTFTTIIYTLAIVFLFGISVVSKTIYTTHYNSAAMPVYALYPKTMSGFSFNVFLLIFLHRCRTPRSILHTILQSQVNSSIFIHT